ncbi:PadR family transcriptional regulator [Haloarcula laminariae]|uniref:PadR family transcriptional regulator n=1 Tax=Haloarcula laminariae TaxID=2961577 RepID=UPI00387DC9F7
MLYLLAAKRDQADYGLGLKRSLEGYYDRDVNHGRLYPNLDDLVERGLVEKSELDKRTNEYALTAAGEELLAEDANRRHDVTSDLEGDR